MPTDVDVVSLAEKLEGVRTAVSDASSVHQHAVDALATHKATVVGFEGDLRSWLATFDAIVVPHVEAVVDWVDGRSKQYVFGSAVAAVRTQAGRLTAPDSGLRALEAAVGTAAGEFATEIQRHEQLSRAMDGVKTWFDVLATDLPAQLAKVVAMERSDVTTAADLLEQVQSWLTERSGEAWAVRRPVVETDNDYGPPPFIPARRVVLRRPNDAVAKAAGTVTQSLEAALGVAAALAQSRTFASGD